MKQPAVAANEARTSALSGRGRPESTPTGQPAVQTASPKAVRRRRDGRLLQRRLLVLSPLVSELEPKLPSAVLPGAESSGLLLVCRAPARRCYLLAREKRAGPSGFARFAGEQCAVGTCRANGMLGVLGGLCLSDVAQREGGGLGRVDHRACGGGCRLRGGRGGCGWRRGRFRCGRRCGSGHGRGRRRSRRWCGLVAASRNSRQAGERQDDDEVSTGVHGVPSRSVGGEFRDRSTHSANDCRPSTSIDQVWCLPAWMGRNRTLQSGRLRVSAAGWNLQ